MQTSRDIYSISRLNSELHQVLKNSFPLLWVEGEISNLSTPRSGHLYFSLKDPHAQIRCAMFRNKHNLLRLAPADGMQVLVRVRIAVYEPRGDCQLVVEHMEQAGAGQLQRKFEALKQKLQAAGLFAAEKKKPLPVSAQKIGVITSPSGAALRDILQILARRYPLARIVIYPSSVQGEQAPEELYAALSIALERAEVDVLILARGGGSLEDLAAFNDEKLARLIATADIPIVSAVGHEIDFTIADFVADRRAPTPSAAAELVSPDSNALKQQFAHSAHQLRQTIQRNLQQNRTLFNQLAQRLQRSHPGTRLQQRQQYLDELQNRLHKQWNWQYATTQQHLAFNQKRLYARHPGKVIQQIQGKLDHLEKRLQSLIQNQLRNKSARLEVSSRELHVLSPLATLQRGYSIVQRVDQKVVRSVDEVAINDDLTVRLAQGEIGVKVSRKEVG